MDTRHKKLKQEDHFDNSLDLSDQSPPEYDNTDEPVKGQCVKKVTDKQNIFDQFDHFEVKRNQTEVFCVRCGSKKPLSLQKICKSLVVRNESLTIVACRQLPADLVEKLMKTAVYLLHFDSLRDIVKPSIKVLLKCYPCEVFDMASMTEGMKTRNVLNELVLEVLSEVLDAGMSLEQTDRGLSRLREYRMVSITPRFIYTDASFDNREFYVSLSNIATKTQAQRKNHDGESQVKYIITTEIHVTNKEQLQRTVSTLYDCQQPNSPFEIRIVRAYFGIVHVSDIATCWQDAVKPEFLEELCVKKANILKLSPHEISVIDKLLASCVRLSHLSLSQCYNRLRPDPNTTDMANAMSSLLRHNQNIKTLRLSGFPIEGHAAEYHLPPRLEALWLSHSVMTLADWEYWANNDIPNNGSLKLLSVHGYHHIGPSDGQGFLNFIKKHAETLIVLDISLQPPPNVDMLQEIATISKYYKVLRDFYYTLHRGEKALDIINEVMPWYVAVESLESFTLNCYHSQVEEKDKKMVRHSVEAALNCVGRPKPMDFIHIAYKYSVGPEQNRNKS